MFIVTMSCIIEQIVQEYERAVIFRLGRILPGGARGPGEIIQTSYMTALTSLTRNFILLQQINKNDIRLGY